MMSNQILQLLELCKASKSLTHGKTIHQYIIKHNHYYTNATLLHKLTRIYIQCNNHHYAYNVFKSIPISQRRERTVLWNQIIRAFAFDGPFEKGVELYQEMVAFGIVPTKYTYPIVVKACANMGDVGTGLRIHEDVKRCNLDADVYVSTALVDFYVKCGWLERAWDVFDGMIVRDVVSWNVMISGFSVHGLVDEVIGLVIRMQELGLRPNSSTMVAILPVVGDVNMLSVAKSVHCYCVRRGYDDDVVTGTGILDVYGKCGLLAYSRRIFAALKLKNEITWSAMIGACVTCYCLQEGFQVLRKMREKVGMSPSPALLATIIRGCAKIHNVNIGRPMHNYAMKLGSIYDLMVGNTLLSLYAKCGMMDDALRFFEEMTFIDSVSYSAIISGCVQNGNAEAGVYIFRRMLVSGVEPELATMKGFFPACAQLVALRHGCCGHGYSVVRGFTLDLAICNALIDMYGKCGKIRLAKLVFDNANKRDIVSWNAMICGFGMHGLGRDAIALFHDMQTVGQRPDDATFVGLLSACSHSGLVKEGMRWFFAMSKEYGIMPRKDHYLCMADLLSRAGLLDEAYRFIKRMPINPDVRIWNSLLASCRTRKNIELGEEVSRNIQSLRPETTGNFILLSDMYSTAGRWTANVRVA